MPEWPAGAEPGDLTAWPAGAGPSAAAARLADAGTSTSTTWPTAGRVRPGLPPPDGADWGTSAGEQSQAGYRRLRSAQAATGEQDSWPSFAPAFPAEPAGLSGDGLGLQARTGRPGRTGFTAADGEPDQVTVTIGRVDVRVGRPAGRAGSPPGRSGQTAGRGAAARPAGGLPAGQGGREDRLSTNRAIAAVTATLRNMLFQALSGDATLSGTVVTTKAPDQARQDGATGNQINLFLYRTSIDAAWRNQDLPPARPGELSQPPLPLVLSYLMTAYGEDDDEILAHQLLGVGMQVLNDQPLLSPALLRRR